MSFLIDRSPKRPRHKQRTKNQGQLYGLPDSDKLSRVTKKSKQEKKGKLNEGFKRVSNPTEVTDFLDFLQTERNHVLMKNQKQNARLDLVQNLDTCLLDQLLSIKQRNAYKMERNVLVDEMRGDPLIGMEDFDSKIVPLMNMYFEKSASSSKLIEMYRTEFQPGHHAPTISSIEVDICPTCNVEYLEVDNAMLLCPSCAVAKPFMDASVSTVAYGDEIEYTSFSYKRINHLNEWLNHFQAKETTPVPEDVLRKVMELLYSKGLTDPKKITFNEVKKAQKELSQRKYYDQTMQVWCRLTGNEPVRLDPICEEKIRLMFIQIQKPFKKHCPPERKNFLSYPFVMFSFCKLLGYDHLLPYFSLLKGRDKLKLQESIFKLISDDLGWNYSP